MNKEFSEQTNGTKELKSFFSERQIIGREKTKHEHEYQEVCSNLETIYGKAIWTLPFKKGVTEFKIMEAHKIAQKRGVLTFNYLVGIINRL